MASVEVIHQRGARRELGETRKGVLGNRRITQYTVIIILNILYDRFAPGGIYENYENYSSTISQFSILCCTYRAVSLSLTRNLTRNLDINVNILQNKLPIHTRNKP